MPSSCLIWANFTGSARRRAAASPTCGNTSSAYWRSWLNPRFRCLVPATSYCEYQEGSKVPTCFALGLERPLFAFAGIWRPWTGVRAREAGEHKLFAFLTTEANDVVGPVHAAAMPVV